MLLPCKVSDINETNIKTKAFLDCGCTTTSLIDIDVCANYKLYTYPLHKPKKIITADGTESISGLITHGARLKLQIGDHSEEIDALVTKLGNYDFILGLPWLSLHNPSVNWASKIVTFDKVYCQKHCFDRKPNYSIPQNSPQIDFFNKSKFDTPGKPRKVGAAAFLSLVNREDVEIFSTCIKEIDLELQKKEHGNILKQNVSCAKVSLEDVRIALAPKPFADPKIKLPSHFHQYLHLFDAKKADILPEHRDCDHKINLKQGTIPPSRPLYQMSTKELLVLRKFLDENLAKGFIRPSTSPTASPVLFAKKPGGGLRFCVDYRALNAITIKNKYPLPLIQETLSQLSRAKYYTKLDIISAFNCIRMQEGQEWLTAFNTRYGLFESLVMPFGLCNAPATFQARINEILRPYLDIFCTAYIDDILIYSDSLEEHRKHVKQVFEALCGTGLQLDIKKCEFEVPEVKYLGMIISTSGVKVDPQKIKCIIDWKPPQHVKDVQAFLGFSNFYRRFIDKFSLIVKPLVALTKKDAKFLWSDSCQKAFESLKSSFIKAPVLKHFDPDRKIYLETDASDFVTAAVLSQEDGKGILHPVAFMSKKFDPAECNYEIYDKELLAIVRSFECWEAELKSSIDISVLTDHRNLEYFMTTKQLSRRQVRWSEFLSEFDFKIKYRPAKYGKKPDSLTRRSQDLPSVEEDARRRYQNQTLLKYTQIDPLIRSQYPDIFLEQPPDENKCVTVSSAKIKKALVESVIEHADLKEAMKPTQNESSGLVSQESVEQQITVLLEEGYSNEAEIPCDPFWAEIKAELTKKTGIPFSKKISLSECKIQNNRLYFRNRLYVPDHKESKLRRLLLQSAHDSTETGHPGGSKLYEILSREYFWPSLHSDCTTFSTACYSCKRAKTPHSRYQGALKPLPISTRRWRDISVDMIGPLIESNGFNQIMVVVDRLSKMRHYIATSSTMTTKQLADLFIRNVYKLHGLPDCIVSDRGNLFVAELWKTICARLRIDLSLSSSYHPETDGQTEISNAFATQYLRIYVDFTQDDWEDWLALAEFAANNVYNEATKMSPFFANTAQNPRMSFGPPRDLPIRASKTAKKANELGNEFVDQMEQILGILKENITSANLRYEEQANRNRTPAPAYRVGDLVFLNARNINSPRPVKKFDNKFLGPFKIKSLLGTHAYRLELPAELQSIDNSFHTSLLQPVPTKMFPGQSVTQDTAIMIDDYGEKLWAIDKLLNCRRYKGEYQYRIKWRDSTDITWEPLKNVIFASKAIKEFEINYPKKKKPTKKDIEKAKKEFHRTAISQIDQDLVD